MAGVPGRSGGSNRLTADEHIIRGTFRPDRHGPRPAESSGGPVTAADRRQALRGLSSGARRLASRLLNDFSGWDVSSLVTLRAYVLSCERVEALQAAGAPSPTLSREIRCNLSLLAALGLEKER